ncbi:hypothetical protein BT96DRAFT_921492 [Gymnopus androsaceus JB14]|uniref:MYND-type domain-containing protein n=1 Tax=Gymnopus androsaceus JB14 TaxID=1447944 RepID=A0A6A4HKM1_9AGAR|nr:hypothetical protein BT96DRAFT_921492 [Gymnopus androsaceus JB14]
MADNFGAALRKNFSKMSVTNGSNSSGSSLSSSKLEGFADKLTGHADNIIDRAHAGMKLQTCSLCRFVQFWLSCDAICQRDHWKSGHKTDCASFKQPPLAKNFDPSDRSDVPWPHDPIFAQGNKDGLGVWLTTSGSLSSLLQQAFEPVDNENCKPDPMGPPSFQRWAKIGRYGTVGPDTKKFLGSTLLSLRVMVQNRITVAALMKDALLPDDKKNAIFGKSPNGFYRNYDCPSWIDYNGQGRVAILEINGVEAPKGNSVRMGNTKSLLCPPANPGYRVGDGDVWNGYPEIMTQFSHCAVECKVLQPKSKTPGNAWINEARLSTLLPNVESVLLVGRADFDYVQEYYRPYFVEDSDVWAEKRLGGRAKMANDMIKSTAPAILKATMSSMTPENRAEAVRRFQTMGFDIERALQES